MINTFCRAPGTLPPRFGTWWQGLVSRLLTMKSMRMRWQCLIRLKEYGPDRRTEISTYGDMMEHLRRPSTLMKISYASSPTSQTLASFLARMTTSLNFGPLTDSSCKSCLDTRALYSVATYYRPGSLFQGRMISLQRYGGMEIVLIVFRTRIPFGTLLQIALGI